MDHYSKPPLTTEHQIEQLKSRGLSVDNPERAKTYLENIGYYRLSAYFIPYEVLSNDADTRSHQFKRNTNFDDILNLYIFDRKLRLLIMEAIERLEVAIRARWASLLAIEHNDAHAFMSIEHFKDPWKYQKKLAKVSSHLSESEEVFIKHYRSRYNKPYLPPIWAMVETLTFGELSKWIENTADGSVKKAMAKHMGNPTSEVFLTVIQCLSLLRNICAHHGRLWNRKLVKRLPNIKLLRPHLVTGEGKELSNSLYNYLIVISHMMKTIQTNTGWQARLVKHMGTLPLELHDKMGFPEGWQERGFWINAK